MQRLITILIVLIVASGVIFIDNVDAADGTTFDIMHGKTLRYNNTDVTEATDGDFSTGIDIKIGWPEGLTYVFDIPVDIDSYYLYGTGTLSIHFYDSSGERLDFATEAFSGNGLKLKMGKGVKSFKIYTYNSVGRVDEFKLFAYPPPPAPDQPILSLVKATFNTLDITWSNTATKYEVYIDGNSTGLQSATTKHFDKLKDSTNYKIRVRAINEAGMSTMSNDYIFRTLSPPPPDKTPPAVPIGLIGRGGNAQALLTWTPVKDSDLAGYNVYQDGKKVETVTTAAATIRGLTNGQAYSFAVSAYDTSGNESAKSIPVTVTPSDRIDVILIPNADSIIVQITGGSAPYVINWGSGDKTINQSQYTITGLQMDTTYTVTVTDAGGLTSTQTVNTGKDKAYVPPTMPSPQTLFQRIIDVFKTAGTIAIAIIGGAVGLGIMVVLARWGWRLLKNWLSKSK
ncbi:Exoglucanase B precursor [compost metagenome]